MDRIKTTGYSQVYNDGVFGGHYQFKFNNSYKNVKMIFIKATLSTGGVNTNFAPSKFGYSLLKESFVSDSTSSILARTNNNFHNARLDLITDEPLFKKITNSIQPSTGAFGNETVILYIPLMFYFCIPGYEPLKLNKQYYLDIIMQPFGLVEIGIPFTSAKYEMVTFHEYNYSIYIFPDKVKNYKKPFNVFSQRPIFIPAGSKSIKVKLDCPYPTTYLHFQIVQEDFVNTKIDAIKFEIPGEDIMDIDTAINYTLRDITSENVGSTLSVPFSENDPVKFTQEMTPTYVTLTLDNHNEKGVLYIEAEYLKDNEGLFYKE